MFSDLYPMTKHYHDEYLRRHVRAPEPLERSRHELRRAIGHGLIQLGERLAGGDETTRFDEAA